MADILNGNVESFQVTEQLCGEDSTTEDVHIFSSEEEAEQFIFKYELDTCSRYIKQKSRNGKVSGLDSLNGRTVYFKDVFGRGPKINCDGTPFVILGTERRECTFGPVRNKQIHKGTEKTDYKVDRRIVQKTKKMGCLSKIVIRRVLKFPDFKLIGPFSPHTKSLKVHQLKEEYCPDTRSVLEVLVKIEREHSGHIQGSAYIHQPIDRRIIAKIYTLVDDGIVSTSQIQSYLKAFVNTLTTNPTGRRFVPSDTDVRNNVFRAKKTIRWQMRTDHFIAEPSKTSLKMLKTKYPEDNSSHIEWLLRDSTHPSVRMKGTEMSYLPVQCFDPVCAGKAPHMHCPFCDKTEAYTDPVRLNSHYRVKHVDTAIEFAGLKVLRCCDRCDIVGVIKGEKKFKGAHWHCYKCQKWFNRRGEATKHYKKHISNPLTTFQIQVAQDIKEPVTSSFETVEATAHIPTDSFSVHANLTNNVSTQSGSLTMLAPRLEGMVAMPGVDAMETVGVADTQTIMMIQNDSVMQEQCTSQVMQERCTSQEQDTTDLKINDKMDTTDHNTIQELRDQISQLEKEKVEQTVHIALLNKKIEKQAEHIAAYKAREQGLLEQLHKMEETVKVPQERAIQKLCSQLETQHQHLIQQQITLLKHSLMPTTVTQPKVLVLNNHGTHLGQTGLQALNANSNCAAPVTFAQNFATPPIVNEVNAGHVQNVTTKAQAEHSIDNSEAQTEHSIDNSKDEDGIDNIL